MNENKSASPNISVSPPAKGVRLDRRALLRAGAGATPVLLTLASNPVAAGQSCMVASSFVSVATFKSRNPTSAAQGISCGARTVSQWKDYCVSNATFATAKVKDKDVLGSDHPTITNRSLRDWLIVSSATTGTDGLLRHLIAMYLTLQSPDGLKSGWSKGNMTVVELRRVWSQCKGGGNYSPSGSGINWSTTDVIRWLEYQLNYQLSL